jgi:CubicO group peptidase (beta-lactamase class C family)
MLSRRAFLHTAAFTATATAATADAPSNQELSAMAAVANAFRQAHSVPGLSVAVAPHGELLYQQAFGFADRDRHQDATPSHLFRIASVSKPVTSAAIFRLIEQGKLHLEDRVFGADSILGNDFGKPPYRRYVEDIRLKHLLTHTAGGWQNDNADPMFRNAGMNHHDLIAFTLANAPLGNPPGEHYAYSNFGYCVVGRIIEKVTGQPYERHVREAVLAPCGITGMRIAGDTLGDRAPGEVVYYGAALENPYSMKVRRMDSHGGWLATAADLVRFATHVDGFSPERNILRADSIREMTTATTANAGYAKGWQVNRFPNWWHTGSLPGTTSILVRTASGFCWAALANFREAAGDTGLALDRMMWELVRQVKAWKA